MAKRKYPWEAWLSNPKTVLRRGVDYDLSQSMMHQSIRNAASLRGIRAHVTDTGAGMIIEIPRPEEAELGEPLVARG